jgi:hypothetical protein
MRSGWIAVVLFGCLAAPEAISQLAITEAMSSASTTSNGAPVSALADFWELTNFGTNDIDLTGYTWNDNGGGLSSDWELPFSGMIHANESIVFVQSEPPDKLITEQEFRDWWGTNLPASVRVFLYTQSGLGFNQLVDGIRLWAPGETNAANVIDQVDFGAARRGRTFTYDPTNGLFGAFSVEGVDGAFKAATRDDIGSPGTTTGPVPLKILAQPASLSVCAGIDATFTVKAGGLPRPRYQWFLNGSVILGATASSHTVANPQAADAGEYQVEINNGFETLFSRVATLSVSTNSTPPVLFAPLTDALAIVNETVRFVVPVCAYPPPTFQWLANGVVILGATNRTLVVPNVQLLQSGTLYCAQISNPRGATSVCARLIVTPKPNLAITEVMPASSLNCATNADWFELTNCGTNAVNLLGYRWATGNGRMPSFEEPRVVTNHAILSPGQSAIFVERLTREEFFRWWGVDRLPPGLIVITYYGEGLDQNGDELYFWSPGATDPNDPVTSIAWTGSSNGVSKFYLEKGFDALDYDSVLGERGAFPAEQCGDTGSPGYLTNPPPRLVNLSRNNSVSTLRCRVIPGQTYRLKWTRRFTDQAWTTLFARQAADWVETATDSTAGNAEQRFYLLEEVP